MTMIARFKRDIAKHRGRAAVLAVLFVTMVAMGIKAFFELHQPVAVAAMATPDVKPAQPRPLVNSAEAEARISESKKLWHVLREVKTGAAKAEASFAFDPAYYPPPAVDPKRVAVAPPVEAEPAKPAPVPAVDLAALQAQQHARRIQEEGRQLVIKTIAIGNESTPSMAIVNQRLMTVGQWIDGFQLTAIRPRECEFLKDSETVVRRLSEDQ